MFPLPPGINDTVENVFMSKLHHFGEQLAGDELEAAAVMCCLECHSSMQLRMSLRAWPAQEHKHTCIISPKSDITHHKEHGDKVTGQDQALCFLPFSYLQGQGHQGLTPAKHLCASMFFPPIACVILLVK